MLRCAFGAAIERRRPDWDAPPDRVVANAEAYRLRCEAAIEVELGWLGGEAPEPGWPEFPMVAPRPRHRPRLPGGKAEVQPPAATAERHSDEYADHQAAALWLANCRGLFDPDKRPWLLDIVRVYSDWTADANGAAMEKHQEVTGKPREWTNAYLGLLARCVPAMAPDDVDRLALNPIRALPDRPFLDATATFLHGIDVVFSGDDLDGSSIATPSRASMSTSPKPPARSACRAARWRASASGAT